MGKVSQEAKTEWRAQLKPDVAGGAEMLVVTIVGVEFKPSQFRSTQQPVLTFKEFPDNEYRVGKRGTARLCESFGDETDEWIDKHIPLIKSREEVVKNTFIVYAVPPVEEWPELFKHARKAAKGRK